jgi:hypothetical protein
VRRSDLSHWDLVRRLEEYFILDRNRYGRSSIGERKTKSNRHTHTHTHTQTIGKLIDASVKALRSSNEEEDMNMQQHWALLRRCMKKKGYAAQLLADAGGIELIIDSIKDNKDSVHLNGALNLIPYFAVNASSTILQSFVRQGGLDVLKPILTQKQSGIQEILPATQSAWSIYKKERSNVAALMALPGSIEIVRLGSNSGDLDFALDVIREFAWNGGDDMMTQIFIENDGVETMLDLVRESQDRSIRFKACDTLGKLASKEVTVRDAIEDAGMGGVIESMSMKY